MLQYNYPKKSVHLSKKPSETCQEISPSPRDNCKHYCKRNYSELEPVQKQKLKVGLTPFTLYKEAYTINLCHIYKPPQTSNTVCHRIVIILKMQGMSIRKKSSFTVKPHQDSQSSF